LRLDTLIYPEIDTEFHLLASIEVNIQFLIGGSSQDRVDSLDVRAIRVSQHRDERVIPKDRLDCVETLGGQRGSHRPDHTI
jgi:hypothetical protein